MTQNLPQEPSNKLSQKQIRYLRKLTHHLKPIVSIGNAGLTDGVINEIDSSIAHHELLKIKINGTDKTGRLEIANKICQQTGSTLVLSIGHIVTIYRTAKHAQIILPRE